MREDTLPELFDLVPSVWQEHLLGLKPVFTQVENFLDQEVFIPPKTDVFKALSIDPQAVRVVIVGQDPYPNPEHAMGLSFSVPAGTLPLPASLKNIFSELENDLGINNTSGDLTSWTQQGIMLLNRVLTTSPTQSMSHENKGWELISRRILEIVARNNPIAILWGKKAQESSSLFLSDKVLASAHPSPLSAYRGFFGSKPFSKTNEMLRRSGQEIIDWRTY